MEQLGIVEGAEVYPIHGSGLWEEVLEALGGLEERGEATRRPS